MNTNTQGCPVCQRSDAARTLTTRPVYIVHCQACGPFPIQAELPSSGRHTRISRPPLPLTRTTCSSSREIIWASVSRSVVSKGRSGATWQSSKTPLRRACCRTDSIQRVSNRVSVPPAKRAACWAVPSQRRRLAVKIVQLHPLLLVLGYTVSRLPVRSPPLIRHSLAPRNARP